MTRFVGTPLRGIEFATNSDEAISTRIVGDTYPKIRIDAGGRITWSSGTATGDVTLYRDSANVLKTDDSLVVDGLVTIDGASGDEGGEINLVKPETNSTISGNVAIDIYQNKLRIFETTGTNRGAFIDLSAASAAVGSDLLSGGGGATTLDGLTDVTAPTPANGDFLKYNGSAWVNDDIDLGTDTVGNYVQNLVAGTNVTLANNSGEGATPTVTVSGALTGIDSISTPDYIQFDSTVVNGADGEGKLQWDSDFGSLKFGLDNNNVRVTIGMTEYAYCYNADSVTLTKGTPVYIFGGQGSQISIKRALNTSDATSARTLGLVAESIAPAGSGYVATYGVLTGINTTAYDVGDILYLGSTAGSLTTTKPYAPNHYVFVGVVVKDSVGGEIFVKVQNGYELEEIHDVDLVTNPPASGDFLKYNGTLWVNDDIDLGTDTNGDYVALVTTSGIGISASGSGESASVTITSNATNSNTPSTIVSRDSSGNFSAGTITAALSGNASTASALQTARTIELSGDLSGSASFDGSASVSINATIAANSVALGTDTTGNYVSDVTAGTGVTITHTPGEGSSATVAIGQAVGTSASVQFGQISTTGNVTVGGDLTVNGTTTTLNTENLLVEDNIVVLNSGVTGSPTLDAGIEIERGTSTNVSIRWNETSDQWEFTNDGTTYTALGGGGGSSVSVSDTAPVSPSTGDLWFESDTGTTYVYYDSFWVEVGATGGPSALQIVVSDTPPSSPSPGLMWFESDTGATYVYYDSSWIEIGSSALDLAVSAVEAKGDLIVGTADNTVTRLASSEVNGQVLTVNTATATGLQWQTPAAGVMSSAADAAIVIMDIGV